MPGAWDVVWAEVWEAESRRGFYFSWLNLAPAPDGRKHSDCTVNDFLPTVTALLSASNPVRLVPRCGAPVTHA